jgi:hypothetical protein
VFLVVIPVVVYHSMGLSLVWESVAVWTDRCSWLLSIVPSYFSTVNSLCPAYSTISVGGARTDSRARTHTTSRNQTTRPRVAQAFHREQREEIGDVFETISNWYEAQNRYIGAYSRTRMSALRDESATLLQSRLTDPAAILQAVYLEGLDSIQMKLHTDE